MEAGRTRAGPPGTGRPLAAGGGTTAGSLELAGGAGGCEEWGWRGRIPFLPALGSGEGEGLFCFGKQHILWLSTQHLATMVCQVTSVLCERRVSTSGLAHGVTGTI